MADAAALGHPGFGRGGRDVRLAIAVLVPLLARALSTDAVLPLEMALMPLVMIAVMALRFDEYAGPRGSSSASAECAP